MLDAPKSGISWKSLTELQLHQDLSKALRFRLLFVPQE